MVCFAPAIYVIFLRLYTSIFLSGKKAVLSSHGINIIVNDDVQNLVIEEDSFVSNWLLIYEAPSVFIIIFGVLNISSTV